eukprot:Gb_39250 [translate_table: standard]
MLCSFIFLCFFLSVQLVERSFEGMDLALDVFIPEDYVRSRYDRKMSLKQNSIISHKDVGITAGKSNSESRKWSDITSQGYYSNSFNEEILLNCMTP